MNEKLYELLLNIYCLMKKLRIYNIPKLKGIVYKVLSSIITLIMELKYLFKVYRKYSLNEVERDEEVIISLTSFSKRIDKVYLTICTLFEQKYKADKIILWLSKDEFINEIDSLPRELKNLMKCGLKVKFCDDLKPHKKYYYSMKENPTSIIITVDDDVFYPNNVIGELIRLHKKYPKNVICTRAHLMIIENNKIQSYSRWKTDVNIDEEPKLLLCPTGVGGVLYPPKCLSNEVFNKEAIFKTCLTADDLWLKFIGLINGVEVVKSKKYEYTFLAISKSQKNALSNDNVKKNQNDVQLERIIKLYENELRGLSI